jgi:O-acetylserine/cysteine efflux transporter
VIRHGPLLLALAALFLFGIWSNSFIAVGFLLGSDGAPARLDAVSLALARFLPAALICGAYCLLFRRAESLAIALRHWRRLLVCGFAAVPGYHLALGYGQQHGVPAPIASLTTTLVPLFVMLFAAIFLRERLTRRRLLGFVIAVSGMVIVSFANKQGVGTDYRWLVAVTALAPLSWSIYSVVSKPLTGRVSPLIWTYLTTVTGTLMLLPLLPGRVALRLGELDATGWGAVLYLSVPCTVLGYALWTWLLRHLPASTVGFSVFLNPPLTTLSKFGLATWWPATFLFTLQFQEWIGGALTLLGMGIAVYSRRPVASVPLAGYRPCRNLQVETGFDSGEEDE